MIRFELLSWRDMTARDRAAWDAFRSAEPGLRSPYFALGWFDAIEAARGDLKVLRGLDREGAAAFLPVHVRPWGAQPAGGPFADWHGFVSRPGLEFDGRVAVAAAGPGYRFSAAPASDRALAPFASAQDASHLMDLSGGFEAYAQPRGRAAPKAARNWRRGLRRLEEEGREVRFVYDERDPAVLQTLMGMKSAQFRRTRKTDLLSYPWSRRLFEAVFATRTGGFSGLLSSLWIDGEVAAIHFGLRSGPVLHYWQPVFDQRFAAYAPGVVLMAELAARGAADGVTEIDLGPGDFQHKRELANASAPMIAGSVHPASTAGRLAATVQSSVDRWERLPLGPVAGLPGRALRRADRMLARFAPPPCERAASAPTSRPRGGALSGVTGT